MLSRLKMNRSRRIQRPYKKILISTYSENTSLAALKGRESEPQRRETNQQEGDKIYSEKPAPSLRPALLSYPSSNNRSDHFAAAVGIMGTRADEAIASAKRKIQAQSPDFRLESLSDEQRRR